MLKDLKLQFCSRTRLFLSQSRMQKRAGCGLETIRKNTGLRTKLEGWCEGDECLLQTDPPMRLRLEWHLQH